MTTAIDDFVPVIFDDALWAEATSDRAGLINSRDLLYGLRRDLRSQRTERAATLNSAEFRQWLSTQARFERVVNARISEIEPQLRDDPAPRLRRQVTALIAVIAQLAEAIDGTDGDEILDDITIDLGTDTGITLADALDDGRLAMRVKA